MREESVRGTGVRVVDTPAVGDDRKYGVGEGKRKRSYLLLQIPWTKPRRRIKQVGGG